MINVKFFFCNHIKCNEVGSSAATEKEGLIRCMEDLEANQISIGTLITDRHPSIRKYIREEYPEITHYFDVWHIAKSKSDIVIIIDTWVILLFAD